MSDRPVARNDYDSAVWKAVSLSDVVKSRVLLVEDDPSVRSCFHDALEAAGYEVREAATMAEARALMRQSQDFHAALVDYTLPDGRVTALVAELLQRRPLCRSVVVTGAAGNQVANETARAGAHAYLRKPNTTPELLDAVARTVRSTLEWRKALSHTGSPSANGAPGPLTFDMQRAVARLRFLGRLSPAETVTAWRLLWGDSNKRIAELLGCTERTVKFHVADVLARTGARSRAALLRVLLEDSGIRDPWEGRSGDES